MASPFPGVDPYLERHWLAVQARLVPYAADQLNESLPPPLVANPEERVAVEDESLTARAYVPDVRVVDDPALSQLTGSAGEPAGAALAVPLRLLARTEPATERFVRIIDSGTQKTITVVEFVSPANKVGSGLRAFRQKRADFLAAGVSFVEIDLVRDGDWRALLRPHACPAAQVTAYRVTVRKALDKDAVYLYPLSLRVALPVVEVPLRENDPPARLALQQLVGMVYEKGLYAGRLRYDLDLDPPIEAADAQWARALLKSQRPPPH